MTKRVIDGRQMQLARVLRRRQTGAERKLWAHLRTLRDEGVRFRRQHSIGKYIVDFVSLDRKLIIELDGSRHGEGSQKERDKQRTEWLEGEGYRVLRFWNNDVLSNIEGVFEVILDSLKQ